MICTLAAPKRLSTTRFDCTRNNCRPEVQSQPTIASGAEPRLLTSSSTPMARNTLRACIGAQPDAGANLFQSISLFKDMCIKAIGGEGNSGRKAAKASAYEGDPRRPAHG